jgi:hypothetical protein
MRHLRVDDSSNVRSLTWVQDQQDPVGLLEVEFSSGSSYRYSNVSLDKFKSACVSTSLGKWVREQLVAQAKLHPVTKVANERLDADTTALKLIASMKPQSRLGVFSNDEAMKMRQAAREAIGYVEKEEK